MTMYIYGLTRPNGLPEKGLEHSVRFYRQQFVQRRLVWGIAYYSQRLSIKEQRHYQLLPLGSETWEGENT
jgi:hypothetical protein